jgi:hypothetical protein
METPVKTYTGGKLHHCNEPEKDDLTVAYLSGYHDGKKQAAESTGILVADLRQQLEVASYWGPRWEEEYAKNEPLRQRLNEVIDECGEYACENNGLKQQLAECQKKNDKLMALLRRHITVYRVADEAWDPEAECDRLLAKELE